MALKLKLSPSSSIEVFNFDGAGEYIDLGSLSYDASTDKTIYFNMWIDTSEGHTNETVLHFLSAGSDYFKFRLDGSLFKIQPGALGGGAQYYIEGHTEKIINCEVSKSSNVVNYFKINGVEQTDVGEQNLGGGSSGWYIGNGQNDILNNATVWDIKIYDVNSGQYLHQWDGYPNPTSDSAWVDKVGSKNGTVINSGTATSRIISGGVTSIINKLKIFPSGLSRLLLSGETTGNYLIAIGSRLDPCAGVWFSTDNGETFTEDPCTYQLKNGSLNAGYLYITPDTNHIMIGINDDTASATAGNKMMWSHDKGNTWNYRFLGTTNSNIGYIECDDSGQIIIKGSWDNSNDAGIELSTDGGDTWDWFETVGGSNRKYAYPHLNVYSGQYIMASGQYYSSIPETPVIYSSNYGTDVSILREYNPVDASIVNSFSTINKLQMSGDGKYMIFAAYGIFQNSSDYGYSWVTHYESNNSYGSDDAAYGLISIDGKYQMFTQRQDVSSFFSDNYGVSFTEFYDTDGSLFTCNYGRQFMNRSGNNMIALRSYPGSGFNLKEVWRNRNFDSNGWYLTHTFDSDMHNMDMSSDGNLVFAILTDGSMYYSINGGDSFIMSSDINPMDPSTAYIAIS